MANGEDLEPTTNLTTFPQTHQPQHRADPPDKNEISPSVLVIIPAKIINLNNDCSTVTYYVKLFDFDVIYR